MLDTAHRTIFLDGIDDPIIKKKLEFILNDETRSTDFILNTSVGHQTLLSPDVSEFEPGDKIKQFIIIKLIAKGGMGSVYLAYDDKLKRNVALKSIRSEYLNSESTKMRFRQEAIILSKINHPSICQIYDIIECEKSELLVLELVHGETLGSLTPEKDKLLDVFIQIASALKAAHEKGVIHRDLKPDNIMLNEQDLVKILDFGIAKTQKEEESHQPRIPDIAVEDKRQKVDKTKMGTVMGTLIYMSPEQASGKAVDKESDIYSFGIIMQELLTGSYAYEMEDTDNLRKQVINANIINNNNLPKIYKNLIASMTDKDMQSRPTAKQISKELLNIKKSLNNKKNAAIKLIFILVIVLLSVFLIWQHNNNLEKSRKSEFLAGLNAEIKDVEEGLKKIYMLPLHDLTDDKRKIINKTNEIYNNITNNHFLKAAEKSYYSGRLYAAQGDFEKAVNFLNEAWNNGINNKDLPALLANSYSLLFYNKLHSLLNRNGYVIDRKNSKIQELEKNYLEPAKKYYSLSSLDVQYSDNMTKALIAWANDETEKAIQILDNIITDKDWLFEAYMLKASFLYTLGQSLIYAAKDDEAYKFRLKSLETFNAAKIRGRSYAPAYYGYCSMQVILLLDGVQRTGVDVSQIYNDADIACKAALLVSDVKSPVYASLAKLRFYYFINQMNKGERNQSLIDESLQYNQKSIDLDPTFINYNTRAEIYSYSAKTKINWGGDPTEDMENSISAIEKSLELGNLNNVFAYNTLISSLSYEIQYSLNIGSDSSDSFNRALKYYDQAMSLKDLSDYTKMYLLVNLSLVYDYHIRNQILRNTDSGENFKKAVDLVHEVHKINNKEPISYAVLSELYLFQAINDKDSKSLEYINLSLDNISEANKLFSNIGDFVALEAYIRGMKELILYQNKSHQPDFSIVFEMFKKSIELDKSAIDIYHDYAEMCLISADFLANSDKYEIINRGLDMADKAIEINQEYSYAYLQKARLIDYALRHKLNINYTKKDADSAFEKATSINPLLTRDIQGL